MIFLYFLVGMVFLTIIWGSIIGSLMFFHKLFENYEKVNYIQEWCKAVFPVIWINPVSWIFAVPFGEFLL